MKYREFLSLTDEEIRFILTDIFHPIKIENIQRDKEFNEITADITTDGWNDGETENFESETKKPQLNGKDLEIEDIVSVCERKEINNGKT